MELHAGVTQGVAFGGVVIAWSTGGATETGRLYFVMELVKGDPITAAGKQRLPNGARK